MLIFQHRVLQVTQFFPVFLLESFRTYVLVSVVVRKFVESELSSSSCATEQVLENNKLSRSVFAVLV